MDRSFEQKIPAMLDAIGAPVTRAQLYSRVSDEVDDEEHLAKILGRLVAAGFVLRRDRPRFNTTAEFVYGTPNTIDASMAPQLRESFKHLPPPAVPRLAAIAAAAKKVQPPTPANEATMPANKIDPEKVLEYLTPARGWLQRKTIAKALKIGLHTAGKILHALAASKQIQSRGNMRSLAYASFDVDVDDDRAAAAAPVKKKSRKPSRSARLKAAHRIEPAAAQLPVPIPQRRGIPQPDEFINCAIEDSGVVAITNGNDTLRLSPSKIDQVVKFLERTQLIWKEPAQ